MAEPKWTPAPWRIVDGPWLVGADGHATLAELLDPRGGLCAEESEANACLIAAAPELYDALAAIGAVFLRNGTREEYDNAYRQAGIAALAKARGET